LEIENYCVPFADVPEMRKFYADMEFRHNITHLGGIIFHKKAVSGSEKEAKQ